MATTQLFQINPIDRFDNKLFHFKNFRDNCVAWNHSSLNFALEKIFHIKFQKGIRMKGFSSLVVFIVTMIAPSTEGFSSPFLRNSRLTKVEALQMALDAQMEGRLDGIRRSYLTLTERLGDPDVLGDAKLLRKIMSDRAQSEDVVNAYDEVR